MVDLRSDTISMPTREMLETILEAKLGDDGRTDSKGRGEDLAVNELEDLAAEMTGKEAAVLFPSGTQGNTSAILAYCRPGQKDNLPDLDDMRRILESQEIALLCIENTHNFSGGTCVPLERMKAIHELAKEFGVPVHMDGARMFNAVVALGVEAREMCKYVDSVMFCISKGLGAPIGSLVCCSEAFSMKIRDKRKLLGGAMRQAGVIAAPGMYALTHNIERLAEDNANAAYAAEQLKDLKNTKVYGKVMSNIIVLDANGLGLTPGEYCGKAAEKGLLIKPVLKDKVRLVFYRDISREDTEKAVAIIRELDSLR